MEIYAYLLLTFYIISYFSYKTTRAPNKYLYIIPCYYMIAEYKYPRRKNNRIERLSKFITGIMYDGMLILLGIHFQYNNIEICILILPTIIFCIFHGTAIYSAYPESRYHNIPLLLVSIIMTIYAITMMIYIDIGRSVLIFSIIHALIIIIMTCIGIELQKRYHLITFPWEERLQDE